MHLRKSVLRLAGLASIFTVSALTSPVGAQSMSELKWQATHEQHHGQLNAMLELIAETPVIPHFRSDRSARELFDVLVEAGRFDELGLTQDEGWTLVKAVYEKHGLPIDVDRRVVGDTEPFDPNNDPAETPDFRSGTEFENLNAVLMRWPWDWASQKDEYAQMVQAIYDGDATAAIWTNTSSQKNEAISYLENRGVPTSHILWVTEQTNSVWMRDYGPNFIYESDGPRWGVVDFHYYNSRPADDDTPLVIASAMNVPVMDRQFSNVVHTEGGNLNRDGVGCVVFSERTYSNNGGVNHDVIDARIKTAFNANKALVPEDPSLDGTGHVDMFLKIVDEDTVVVAQYDPDEKDYQILEDAATLFMSETNGAGVPWEVHRIWQPDVYYIFFIFPVVRTYTNSLVVNDVVMLPVFDIPYDAQAVAVYEALYPGRTIVPINAEVIIESGGAWHCVTMEYPDPLN